MFTSKAIVPVVLVVALAMLLQSMQATAAAAPPLPAICMREARELCHSSSSLVQVRACLAEQAGVSPGCLSALKMSRQGNLRSKRRAEQRTRLLKEAPSWENTVNVDNASGGGTKTATISWNVLNPTKPMVEARIMTSTMNWIGFGFSPNGGMVGSLAVVYRPDNGAGSEVQVVMLNQKNEAGIVTVPTDSTTLNVLDFGQDANGTFMHYTVDATNSPADASPGAQSDVVWAIGVSNTFTLGAGYHGANKSTFQVTFNPTPT